MSTPSPESSPHAWRASLGADESLVRVAIDGAAPTWAVVRDGRLHALRLDLVGLCRLGVEGAQRHVAECLAAAPVEADEVVLHAPIDAVQEVWAAGVTYERSRAARIEESGAEDLYSQVYGSARPELFLKATGARVVGPGADVGVRADATWSVPEPELGVVFDAAGAVLGFVVGDDVSSRDIEGANALYLPQAKVYDRSCALGPAIVPAWALGEDPAFEIALRIERDGRRLYTGTTSTAQMRRHWVELGSWLRASLSCPDGVVLLTGTGIVPGSDVTLQAGDRVVIAIEGVGTLETGVTSVGTVVGAPEAVAS